MVTAGERSVRSNRGASGFGTARDDIRASSMNEIRILSATGILGSGFREETLERAMSLQPHFIAAAPLVELEVP